MRHLNKEMQEGPTIYHLETMNDFALIHLQDVE